MNLKAYQTSKGTCWLIRDGQTVVARFGPCSKAEAVQILKKAERARSMDMASKQLGIARSFTVREWLAVYRGRYLPRKAANTQRSEKRMLNKIEELWGDRLLSSITKGDLEDYKTARAEARHSRTDRLLSPWTVNADLRILKHLFNTAVDDGHLAASPATRKFELLPQDRPVVPRIGWKPVFRLLQHAGRLLKVAILVVAKCGLRPGEVLHLQVKDVVIAESGFLPIRSTPTYRTKTRTERLVPVSADVLQWLQWLAAWWVNPRTGAVQRRDPATQPFLFCHEDGRPIRSLKKAMQLTQARAGVDGPSLKDLRKFYASHLAAANVHPEKVRLATGHADVQVLLDHYTSVDLEDVARVVQGWPTAPELPGASE